MYAIRSDYGWIKVSGRLEEENVILEVEDDGLGIDNKRLNEIQSSLTETKGDGFGMRTVHQRIQILFGSEYGLKIESKKDNGTKVVIRITSYNVCYTKLLRRGHIVREHAWRRGNGRHLFAKSSDSRLEMLAIDSLAALR